MALACRSTLQARAYVSSTLHVSVRPAAARAAIACRARSNSSSSDATTHHQQHFLPGTQQQQSQPLLAYQEHHQQQQEEEIQQQQQQQQRFAAPARTQPPPASSAAVVAGASLLLAAAAALPGAASALTIHTEPSNALSLPTWAIHVSSVTEWVAAMVLFWKYAEVTGNQRWKGMTWGMMPSLGSAMAACTWHFFYNSPDLDFLVALQAFLTVLGNCTCWYAAYRIYDAAQTEQASS